MISKILGGDMTPECAYAKLATVLAKDELNITQKRKVVQLFTSEILMAIISIFIDF